MLRCPSVRSSRFPPGRLAGTPCVINLGLFVSFLLMGWIDHMSKRGLLGDTTGRGETAAELGETRSPGLATDAGPEFLASLPHCLIVVAKEPFYEAPDESALRCTSRPDLGSHPEPDTAQEAKEDKQPRPRLRDRESCIRASKSTGARARSRRQGTCRTPPHFVSETKAGDPDEWQPRGDLYPDDGIFFLLPIVESSLELFKSIRYD